MKNQSAANLLKEIRAILKKTLRSKGIHYQDLAKIMGVSEVTVKRMFSSEDISFAKLTQLSTAAGISLVSVMETVSNPGSTSFQLTKEQEGRLASKPELYALVRILWRGWKLPEIEKKFGLESKKLYQALRELEKLKLGVMSKGEGFIPVNHGMHLWIQGGPLEKMYYKAHLVSYLQKAFTDRDTEKKALFLYGERLLHPKSQESFRQELENVLLRIQQRSLRDALENPKESLVPATFLLSIASYTNPFEEKLRVLK